MLRFWDVPNEIRWQRRTRLDVLPGQPVTVHECRDFHTNVKAQAFSETIGSVFQASHAQGQPNERPR